MSLSEDGLMNNLYYEDVVLNEKIVTPGHTVRLEDIMMFADVTLDRHPLHTDPGFAAGTQFGQVIGHGLFGLALIEGLKYKLRIYENTSVASLGWNNVKFRAPLLVGDTVHVEMVFDSKRESRDGIHGIATEKLQLVNQNGVTLVEAEHVTLLLKRQGRAESVGV